MLKTSFLVIFYNLFLYNIKGELVGGEVDALSYSIPVCIIVRCIRVHLKG